MSRSLAGPDDDDELEPYEVMALENQSKQNGKRIKETKQTTPTSKNWRPATTMMTMTMMTNFAGRIQLQAAR